MTTEAVLQPRMMCVRFIKPLPSILALRHQRNGSKLPRFTKNYDLNSTILIIAGKPQRCDLGGNGLLTVSNQHIVKRQLPVKEDI